MPNTSGAPVIDNDGYYAGMHIGTVWHLNTTEGHGQIARVEPPNKTTLDAQNMWVPPESVRSSSADSDETEQGLSARLDQVDLSSKHAIQNIPEKESLATFVPLSTILDVLIEGKQVTRLPGSIAGDLAPQKRSRNS